MSTETDARKRIKKGIVLLLSIMIAIILGAADYFTGYELSFSIFYLVPVSFATWFDGRISGLLVSVLCAIIWNLSNRMAGEVYTSPLIPYWNTATRLVFFSIITLLLMRLKNALEHERALSKTDYLTGILNSRAFYQIASDEIERQRRYNRPISIVYIDVDGFKTVNDRYGHSSGDALLKTIAYTCCNELRIIDMVARLGGDEFAILLSETDNEQANTTTKRIQALLIEQMHKNDWPVTFSMGLVTCLVAPPSVNELVHMADTQMYLAKENGKNSIQSFIYRG